MVKYIYILLLSLISYEAVSQIGLYRLERADSQNYVLISDTLGVTHWRTVDSLEHIMPTRAYGEMFVIGTTPDTITFGEGSTTPQKVRMQDGLLNGFSHNSGTLTYDKNDTITTNITYSASYTFSDTSNIYGWVYKNGSEIERSEFTDKAGTILLSITTDDTIELYVAPDTHTGGNDLIINNANLTIIRAD